MQVGEMTEQEYWLLRTAETGRLIGAEWSEVKQLLQATRGADPMGIIRPEALAAIDQAASRGHKLGILSNELDLFYGPEFRGGLRFLDGFDSIIDATYTGVLKPDPAAYRGACDALQVPPSACVFVDDQPRNIAGADAVGMATVHFDVRDPTQSYQKALGCLAEMETAPP